MLWRMDDVFVEMNVGRLCLRKTISRSSPRLILFSKCEIERSIKTHNERRRHGWIHAMEQEHKGIS